jgi:hypothetical protein
MVVPPIIGNMAEIPLLHLRKTAEWTSVATYIEAKNA